MEIIVTLKDFDTFKKLNPAGFLEVVEKYASIKTQHLPDGISFNKDREKQNIQNQIKTLIISKYTDELNLDILEIQGYFKIYHLTNHLKKKKIQINDRHIMKTLQSKNINNLYKLVKKNICQYFNEDKIIIIENYLSKYGLKFNMTNIDFLHCQYTRKIKITNGYIF